MRAFEIHFYRSGRWIIDSVFDDSELALFEARRMDETGRYHGLRVVEEIFDEESAIARTRTIFRGAKVAALNARVLEQAREKREQLRLRQCRRDVALPDGRTEAGLAQAHPYRLIALASAVVLGGLGLVIAIRELETFL